MSVGEPVSELYQSTILIVDDDAISRFLIEKTLKDRGFSQIYSVDSGVKAMTQLDRIQPDLIILDIFMVGLNGLDCCKWIRTQSKQKNMPILMLTSLTDEKMRFQAFEAGASDFVNKPLHSEELYARVKVHLENRLAMKSLERYKKRLELELKSASELQSTILPSEMEMEEMRKNCKLDIAAHLNTSSEIGGDFWGMKRLFPHQTAFWMVDFSGHGVTAALNAFRLQAYIMEHSECAARPGDYLSHLNDKLLHLLIRGYFATMFYGILDTKGNKLHYACACSPHPLILRKNGNVEMIDGTGAPLGICLQFYETKSIDFKPGDTFMLYSDALTETPNASGKCISEEEMKTVLAGQKNEPALKMKESMLNHFSRHISLPAEDDLSLTFIRRMD
ncbi:SpoIIE family protein phosphatase [bacterium]|nr:SpoIIE family protein phosphatase [bacterium]